MRPSAWHPPIELSSFEQIIIARIKHAKLFVSLRHHRHELFDDAFQEELAALYAPGFRGHPPLPPAQLALAIILQAYTGVSDDEVIEATLMDRRWQLVLDCLDTEQAPFSKGTLVAFRTRLIEAQMDRRLIERTIELASFSQEFGPRALRAALDSSPLWGAGRVEDTYNLVGHALKKVIQVVAEQQGREPVEVAKEAGAELVCDTSLKVVLDQDWDQIEQREEALGLVLQVLRAVETWVQTLQQEEVELAQPSLEIAQQVEAQDVQVDEKGRASLIKGVAKDRRISVEDSQMRHGRKSRSVRVDGYKRHVLHDLDTGLIRAVGVTPANAPEASVTEAISEDLEQQKVALKELHIDRAYLSSHLVRERADELEVYCKAWPVRDSKRFHKQAFTLDWERQVIRCPAAQEMPFVPGGVVHFPKDTCLMKLCSSSCVNVSGLHKGGPNCVSGWRLSILLRMSVDGKDGAHAIADCAKISSICVGAPSSTICMFWPVLSRFKLMFRTPLDYLTGALALMGAIDKCATMPITKSLSAYVGTVVRSAFARAIATDAPIHMPNSTWHYIHNTGRAHEYA